MRGGIRGKHVQEGRESLLWPSLVMTEPHQRDLVGWSPASWALPPQDRGSRGAAIPPTLGISPEGSRPPWKGSHQAAGQLWRPALSPSQPGRGPARRPRPLPGLFCFLSASPLLLPPPPLRSRSSGGGGGSASLFSLHRNRHNSPVDRGALLGRRAASTSGPWQLGWPATSKVSSGASQAPRLKDSLWVRQKRSAFWMQTRPRSRHRTPQGSDPHRQGHQKGPKQRAFSPGPLLGTGKQHTVQKQVTLKQGLQGAPAPPVRGGAGRGLEVGVGHTRPRWTPTQRDPEKHRTVCVTEA